MILFVHSDHSHEINVSIGRKCDRTGSLNLFQGLIWGGGNLFSFVLFPIFDRLRLDRFVL